MVRVVMLLAPATSHPTPYTSHSRVLLVTLVTPVTLVTAITPMLPLRFAIVASLAAVCLWGLFSLLENLRAPELLRSTKAVIVKGCDVIETEEARQRCPQLYCQKALIDRKVVPLRSRFEVTTDKRLPDQQLVAGVASVEGSAALHFACVLENDKVSGARRSDALEIQTLAAQAGGWSL